MATCAKSPGNSQTRSRTRIAAFLAICGLGASAVAVAQSCNTPFVLPRGASMMIDTCSSTYTPATLCADGSLLPVGPAIAFVVALQYPDPTFFVQVTPGIGSTFDPAIVVQSRQCATGPCPFVIDDGGPGSAESFNLGNLDSGVYYFVVTGFNPDQPCGAATFYVSYEEAGGTNDGIYRAGFDY